MCISPQTGGKNKTLLELLQSMTKIFKPFEKHIGKILNVMNFISLSQSLLLLGESPQSYMYLEKKHFSQKCLGSPCLRWSAVKGQASHGGVKNRPNLTLLGCRINAAEVHLILFK